MSLQVIDAHKTAEQSQLIARLNPLIRGWANYYSTVVSKRIYTLADTILFSQLKAWAKHRHPNKSSQWVCRKYWQTIGLRHWVFKPINQRIRLLKYDETPIIRHIKTITITN